MDYRCDMYCTWVFSIVTMPPNNHGACWVSYNGQYSVTRFCFHDQSNSLGIGSSRLVQIKNNLIDKAMECYVLKIGLAISCLVCDFYVGTRSHEAATSTAIWKSVVVWSFVWSVSVQHSDADYVQVAAAAAVRTWKWAQLLLLGLHPGKFWI